MQKKDDYELYIYKIKLLKKSENKIEEKIIKKYNRKKYPLIWLLKWLI